MVAGMKAPVRRWTYGLLLVVATMTGVLAAGRSSGSPSASNSNSSTHNTFSGLTTKTTH